MNKVVKVVIGTLLMASAGLASAVPLTGGVSFSSTNTTGMNWDSSADFINIAGNAAVDDVSGEFANYLSIGDLALFSNIDYSTPFTAATIWSAGGLSFTLEAMTTIQEFTRQPWLDPFALVLAGTGTLSDGIETTTGYWNMSVNTAGNSFSWSSSADVNGSDIPEPASMSLLALGLFGFHVRRKLKK